MPSVKISDATYARIKAVAEAEQRTIAVTIDRLIAKPNINEAQIVDQYLNLTALNEVQRRWHRVTASKKGVRVDGR